MGGFGEGDVTIVIEPRAADLLRVLDGVASTLRASGADALFVFYFSEKFFDYIFDGNNS